MKIDEKEIASIIRLSRSLSDEDINEMDYLRYTLAKLKFEMKLKKEKLIEVTNQEIYSKYPANLTDTTTSFLNFINNNSKGFTTINKQDIILAKKGVKTFEELESIIGALYLLYYNDNDEPLKNLIKNVHEKNKGLI